MEPTLPGFNQYCRELMCLAEGHSMVPLGEIKHNTESEALPLPHHTTHIAYILCQIMFRGGGLHKARASIFINLNCMILKKYKLFLQ